MFKEHRTGAAGVGLAGRAPSGAALRLVAALAGAMLLLFLLAGMGETSKVEAAGNAPAAQASDVMPDGCPYYPYTWGYGGPWMGDYGYCYQAPVITACSPLPGVYTCSGYCGGWYGGYYSCAPACYAYSCAPYCVQSYTFYSYVPCQLPPDRVAFKDAPLVVGCGTSSDLIVEVWDTFGHPVVDGTTVTFTTSFGSVTGSATTKGGAAITRLTVPLKEGLAQVVAKAGSVVDGQTIIMVEC